MRGVSETPHIRSEYKNAKKIIYRMQLEMGIDMNEIQDKIDFKLIDQLHSATLNFSKASIQIKQMMFALAAIMGPILIKLAGDALDKSLFICMYIIPFSGFWILLHITINRN